MFCWYALPPPRTRRWANRGKQFVNRTFTLAHPSISINGLPSLPPVEYEQPVDEYEAFNGRLHARVAELAALVEQRTLQNANHRRTAPRAAAAAYEAAIDAEERSAARLRKGWEAKLEEAAAAAAAGDTAGLPVKEIDRRDEVERTRLRATEGLGRLKGTVPEIGGRLEKAVLAADYVLEKREREASAARETKKEKVPLGG